jgi:hypothetical protein
MLTFDQLDAGKLGAKKPDFKLDDGIVAQRR